MGRGRAKAKQQKVARELKYSSQMTDFDALQRELGVSDSHNGGRPVERDSDADSDDYDDWTGTGR
ncbi:DUF3073 domain-containing protein [uncultured Jatrophihabitans sp.]|uniref:DUF3073 domain-containing protein n=1 Tax=uncultured Jatrophihabitans sp. TaxID=1610747 RepID=UPI0035CB167C